MLRVTTESGSVYDFSDDLSLCQRVNDTYGLRRDGGWLRLLETPTISVGSAMRLCLEPLAQEAVMTQRITTVVTDIASIPQYATSESEMRPVEPSAGLFRVLTRVTRSGTK